jgi:malonyl-CoA decarboxylase
LSWDSPASLVEKLIQYEAVHDIRSWGDLKNRLDSDRRCYGFFHPSLPNEPLIFVEVALLNEIADSITPLLDESAAPQDIKKSTVAIFYSISNTQTGLKGVSFGDSLIKRVVQVLKEEFPKLRTFATLSPIPGFKAWASKNMEELFARLSNKELALIAKAVGTEKPSAAEFLTLCENALSWDEKSELRLLLTRCVATYLGASKSGTAPADAVARFHLSNGARIERLNWGADPSAKGIRQSFGVMVNYLYDLRRLDKHRKALTEGDIPCSPSVQELIIKSKN